VSELQKLSLTPRRAAHLVLRRPEKWEPDDEQLVQVMAKHPDLTEAIELALQFAQFVRQRQPEQLDLWLEQALRASFLLSIALPNAYRGLYAVKAGMTLHWVTVKPKVKSTD